jgi:hypothetical protein
MQRQLWQRRLHRGLRCVRIASVDDLRRCRVGEHTRAAAYRMRRLPSSYGSLAIIIERHAFAGSKGRSGSD